MGALGLWGFLGVAVSVALVALGLVVLWFARHRNEDERVRLPVLGNVGNPTCLTVGLCLMISGYHVAAYALEPVVSLVSVPVSRWWMLAIMLGVAIGGSVLADGLERRESDGQT